MNNSLAVFDSLGGTILEDMEPGYNMRKTVKRSIIMYISFNVFVTNLNMINCI